MARRIAGGAALIAAGVIIALLIGEAAARMLGLGTPLFFVYSSRRGWKLRPEMTAWQRDEGQALVRINRWGYRGPQWTRRKPPGTLRIALLGDSFIEAQQVAESATAGALLQQMLTAMLPEMASGAYRWVKRVEVMNFGVDGYGTAQEYFTLNDDVWQFSPDIVVLAFFPGNDLRNNSVVLEGDKCRPFMLPQDGELHLAGPFEDSRWFRLHCFMRFESYHSKLLDLLGQARSTVRSSLRKWRRQGHQNRAFAARAGALREPGINDLIYRPPIDQVWREAWAVSEAEIGMIARNVDQHRARFLLVIVDTGVQTMPNRLARQRYLKAVGGSDLLYPDRRLIAFAEHARIAALDLVPAMAAYAQAHRVYFHGFSNTRMGSGHWNQLGNCVAASMIAVRIAAPMAPANQAGIRPGCIGAPGFDDNRGETLAGRR